MTETVFFILIGLFCAVSVIITPFFLQAQRPGACPKSLTLKMTDSTCFVAVGVLGICMTGSHTGFALYMLIALLLSWVGDFFLHLWGSKVFSGIGFLGFLSSHIFYIIAYNTRVQSLQSGRSFLPVWGIVILFVLWIPVALYFFLKLPAPKVVKPFISLYGLIILTMMIKAFDLAVVVIQTGGNRFGAVSAVVGAILFVLSDLTISLLLFHPKYKKNFPLKQFNIWTYFLAQLFLASLIITCG